MKKEKEYKRMAGRRSFPFRASVWLAKDHVLLVRSHGYSEEYRRFYFNDIQGFLIFNTATGKVLNIIWALIAALFACFSLAGFFVWESAVARNVNGFLATFFLCLLLINIARGPTCGCYLKTAVHTELIGALARFRRAVKTVALLVPIIEQHQGVLSQEFLQTLPATEAPRAASAAAKFPASTRITDYSGSYHVMLFALLLSYGLLNLFRVAVAHIGFSLANGVILLTLMVFSAITMVKQKNSRLPKPVRSFVWLTLAFLLSHTAIHGIYNLVFSLQNPQYSLDPLGVIRAMAAIEAKDSAFLLSCLLYSSAVCFILGIGGLAALRTSRRPLMYTGAIAPPSPGAPESGRAPAESQ